MFLCEENGITDSVALFRFCEQFFINCIAHMAVIQALACFRMAKGTLDKSPLTPLLVL